MKSAAFMVTRSAVNWSIAAAAGASSAEVAE
jgi:hypothetical protein